MAGPVVNLDRLTFDDVEDNGVFTSRRAFIGERIGARDLGYNLTILPPGKVQCPFHSHHGEEEMFFILEGEGDGELRFGDRRYPLRQHDVIACPTGGAEVAHQIINTGSCDLKYLAVSTLVDVEVCEYPDSGKFSAVTGRPGERGMRHIGRLADAVDYYDGEEN
ncbi:MAG: cupin domain-containing protein [Sphingopyxis sp.]|uniref:cupin domain-containing protein n=1 Tax=Sphingopyxis sp. TaxID=1908224 RepID=UPI002ABA2110|nr:cupin domain-containing protein [Sphingopyxis sp.]MDZ3831099.1 cupin domain-containing protein [Sphingopyxis sp.]